MHNMHKRYLLPLLVLFIFLFGCNANETEAVDISGEQSSVSEAEAPETEPEDDVEQFPLPERIEEGDIETEPDPQEQEPEPEAEAAQSAFTVQMVGSAAGMGQREFASPQQVERVLALLPGPSSQPVTVNEPPADMAAVQISVTADGATRSYTIYLRQELVRDDATGLYYQGAEGISNLFGTLVGWESVPTLGGGLTYKGETVTTLYSFQFKFRSYHQITGDAHAQQVLDMIAQKQPDEEITAGNVGFLINTANARYPIYLDGFADMELTNLSIDMLNTYPAHASWLVYMDLSKIQSISYRGAIGQGVSLGSLPAQNLQTTITDPTSIQRIGNYLKRLIVEPDPMIYDTPVGVAETGDLFIMDINFNTGVTYRIGGFANEFSITSTDMTEMITYQCTGNQLALLRDLVSLQG